MQILFEGQEEYGSPNLASFLKKHRNLLKADFCVSADGGQDSPTQGILALGLRGNSGFEVTVRALKQDAHSGRVSQPHNLKRGHCTSLKLLKNDNLKLLLGFE